MHAERIDQIAVAGARQRQAEMIADAFAESEPGRPAQRRRQVDPGVGDRVRGRRIPGGRLGKRFRRHGGWSLRKLLLTGVILSLSSEEWKSSGAARGRTGKWSNQAS